MNIVPSNPKKSPKFAIQDAANIQVSCSLMLLSYLSSEEGFFENKFLNIYAPWVFGILGAGALLAIVIKFFPEIAEPSGMIRIDIEKQDDEDEKE